MNAKRLLSMLLCLLMVVSAFALVACEETTSTESTASEGADTEESNNTSDAVDFDSLMPEFTWSGAEYETFDVLVVSQEGEATYYCEDVVPNAYSTTDASLSEAVGKRNDEILKKYGVTIVAHPVKDVRADLKEDITSNLLQYDAALMFMPAAASLAQEGYLWDLNEFSEYLHFDQPWWDQSATESLSIGGKLFFNTGDISIMPKIVSTAITFNKEILKKNFPETDLYQMVKDRKWTFDKMIEMSRTVTADSDGTSGMTYHDNWGLSASYGDVAGFYIGAGKNYITKDSDDLPIISINDTSSVTTLQKILEALQLKDDWCFHCNTVTDGSNIWVVSLDVFGQNRALFRTSAFSAIKKLRAYDDAQEFGIVPYPMVNEEQDQYYTYCAAKYAYAAVIPTSLQGTDAEYAAFMLEAMAYGGRKYITPAYYETTLKYRDLRDDESGEMLDLVFSNVVYDLGIIYEFGGVSNMIQDMMKDNSTDVASTFESKRDSIQDAIDTCVESYGIE
ncbi:MAG: extracellular solute-binding protein [Clostridia bacterium]|nr:extracellular solute-binding protein [Clostridia bacterium]